jgi:flagellar secretion chaperone FliS
MTGYRATTAYRETEVMSTSPERLVPLLYEHLLVNLKRAEHHIRRGDIEGKFETLGRAQDILAELLSALDFDAGGELASRLASLYGFWGKEISQAGRDLDPKRLQGVVAMVSSLHEAWSEAARLVESGMVPENEA